MLLSPLTLVVPKIQYTKLEENSKMKNELFWADWDTKNFSSELEMKHAVQNFLLPTCDMKNRAQIKASLFRSDSIEIDPARQTKDKSTLYGKEIRSTFNFNFCRAKWNRLLLKCLLLEMWH
jgi:hypothetical protein